MPHAAPLGVGDLRTLVATFGTRFRLVEPATRVAMGSFGAGRCRPDGVDVDCDGAADFGAP